MKKQIRKLTLNKKTISNLTVVEMSKHVGGVSGYTCYHCHPYHTYHCTNNCTQNQNTCPGHKTCYTCWSINIKFLEKMKKEKNKPGVERKLSINKRTISNLSATEMNNKVGGNSQTYCHYSRGCGNSVNCTRNQNTCPGHNTCYTCWFKWIKKLTKWKK